MGFMNKMERKFGKFAIRRLMYYIIILNIAGAVIGIISPAIYLRYLMLDPALVMKGQVWRLFTFILSPQISAQSGLLSIIFFAIEMYLYYMIGSVLEQNWGAFRFNVYYFSGILLNIVAVFIAYYGFSTPYLASLYYVNQSLFLAFAVMFPDMQLLLMGLIPVKVKWLGLLYGLMIAVDAVTALAEKNISKFLLIILAMLNFIVFFLSTRNYKRVSPKQVRRKAEFHRQMKQQPGTNRHRCAICGRTEKDDPNLEFRYCSKCEGNYEYCSDHLYTHVHVKKED